MNWKNHPFAIAVTASVATLTVVATVVFTAIIPTWLKSKDNEIAGLQQEIGDLHKQIERLQAVPAQQQKSQDTLVAQLQKLETENLKLRRQLDQTSDSNMFAVDDVYPRGFRLVRIGDRVDRVSPAYGGEGEIYENEDGWIAVRFKKPRPFSSAAFYFDQRASVKIVTSILFVFDTFAPAKTFNTLKQQLIDKYSETAMKEAKRHGRLELEWTVQNHKVRLGEAGTLHIELVR